MEISGLGFPYWTAVQRRFAPHDPFFIAGNIERELLAKQVALDLAEGERYEIQKIEDAGRFVHCPIVSCGARLNCLEEFEDHYNARHMSACAICSRVYPTSRLLSIHVSEAHDSFFAAKVARGFPMYECLVEGCGAKLKSYKSRKQHLIDKHKFPSTFEFRKAKPSEHRRRRRQINQHKQPSPTEEAAWPHCNGMEVEEMDELVSAVSKLSTSGSTPSTVSFGHRHARGFSFLPRSLRQNMKQQSDAME